MAVVTQNHIPTVAPVMEARNQATGDLRGSEMDALIRGCHHGLLLLNTLQIGEAAWMVLDQTVQMAIEIVIETATCQETEFLVAIVVGRVEMLIHTFQATDQTPVVAGMTGEDHMIEMIVDMTETETVWTMMIEVEMGELEVEVEVGVP